MENAVSTVLMFAGKTARTQITQDLIEKDSTNSFCAFYNLTKRFGMDDIDISS